MEDEKDDVEADDTAEAVPLETPQVPFHEALHASGHMQGFIRFLRVERPHLIRAAGLHAMSPDPHRLGVQARTAWLALSQKEQHQYQVDALSALRAAGIASDLQDAPAPNSSVERATPALLDAEPAIDPVAREDTGEGEDLREAAAASTSNASADAGGRSSLAVDGTGRKACPAKRRRLVCNAPAKQPTPGSREDFFSNLGDDSVDDLKQQKNSELKALARYLGAGQRLEACREKPELIALILELRQPKSPRAAMKKSRKSGTPHSTGRGGNGRDRGVPKGRQRGRQNEDNAVRLDPPPID